MNSKTSYFNRTVFLKNLTRFWPVWVASLLIWIFIMPMSILGTISSQTMYLSTADIKDALESAVYRSAFGGGGIFTAIFSILSAMTVFSYLYQSRSAQFYHSLPVKRESLFVTNYLSGLLVVLFPLVVVFLLSALVEMLTGYLNLQVLLAWLAIVSVQSLLFFSFAAFCAMFTGHIAALPVFFFVLNFLAVGVQYMVQIILSNFVFGMQLVRSVTLSFLSPMYYFSMDEGVYMNANGRAVGIANWPLILGYALAGLLLAVAALAIYKRRNVETAGDLVAFKPVRHVFKYGMALCVALFLSVLFNTIMGSTVMSTSFWRVLVSMLLSGFVGYFAAEMLLSKSFRVFKRGLLGWLIFSGALVVILFAVKLDLIGYERRLPDSEAVSKVYIGNYINFQQNSSLPQYYDGILTQDSGTISAVTALHQNIVEHRASIGATVMKGYSEADGYYMSLCYIMKDGSVLLRSYNLPVSKALLADAASPISQYLAVMNTPENILKRTFPEGLTKYNFDNGSIYKNSDEKDVVDPNGATTAKSSQGAPLSQEQSYTLYLAIVEDIKAGTIGKVQLLPNDDNTPPYYITLSYSGTFQNWRNSNGGTLMPDNTQISVEPTSKNTLAALKSMGILDALK